MTSYCNVIWILWCFIALNIVLTPRIEAATENSFYYIILPTVLYSEGEQNIATYLPSSDTARLTVTAQHAITKKMEPAGNYIIKAGHGSVKLRLPFDNYVAKSVSLTFKLQYCGAVSEAACVTTPEGAKVDDKTAEIPVITKPMLVFVDFQKPIFKPGDNMKFRILSLNLNNLNSINGQYNLVYLQSPSRLRMAQFINVTWLDGLKGFSIPLSADPEIGTWKVVIETGSTKVEETAEVKKYVLPQFTVTLKPPLYMLGTDKYVTYQVCAKYSTNLPMRGMISAHLSLTGHGPKRSVIIASSKLDGKQECVNFTKSTEILGLREAKFYSTKILLNATVTEADTGAKVSKSEEGGDVKYSFFKLKTESPELYYPGLPYYGRAKATNFDGTPYGYAKVDIRIDHWMRRFGYFRSLTADKYGIIKFVIPPIPGKVNDVYLTIRSSHPIPIPYEYNKRGMSEAFTSMRLKRATSPSNSFMRITPLYKMPAQSPCESRVLKLNITANVRLFTRTIHVVTMARGNIVNSKIIQPETNPSIKECQDTDSEESGHYTCLPGAPDSKGFNVKCKEGYTGENCLTPICKQRCENGACGKPSECICKEGWTGPSCTICIRKWGCENGFCYRGNDCPCYPGWTGEFCQLETKSRHYYMQQFEEAKRKVQCKYGCLETDRNFAVYQPNKIEKANMFRRSITIPWNHSSSPTAQLVVYFEYNKEIISDKIELSNLSKCILSQAPTEFKFSSSEVRPGTNVTGEISTTGGNPKCALSIVDIAMSAFGRSGSVNLEELLDQIKQIMKKFEEYHTKDYYRNHRHNICSMKQHKLVTRTKRMVIESRGYATDSSLAFTSSGLILLSNVEIITNCNNYYPQEPGPMILPSVLEDSGVGTIMKKTSDEMAVPQVKAIAETAETVRPKVRSFFPESWKFEVLETVGSTIDLSAAPDSMTTWMAYFYCISSRGLGMAPPASLKVFQPFFIQMVLPYSLIRGEVAKIPVKVFNYIKDSFALSLTVKKSSDFTIIGHDFVEFCISGLDRKTAYFTIKATVIKTTSIEVTAIPLTSSNKLCGQTPKTSTTMQSDAVKRMLLTEPEGIPQEMNVGEVICAPETGKTLEFDLTMIQDVLVPGSARAYLSYTGDIFGPALNNLDKLVKMPYGCGEQNMVTMVPSIFVKMYFTEAGIVNAVISKKADQYMYTGYLRQLKYRFPDGSYAAFVSSVRQGSTWLTAFVLKSFTQAQKYVPSIQDDVLVQATRFLMFRQQTTGCFVEYGQVYSRHLKGGMSATNNDKATMTAFVLSSLLEAQSNKAVKKTLGQNINSAARCLSEASQEDLTGLSTYSLALRTYALVRWDKSNALTIRYMTEFSRRVVIKNKLKYVPEKTGVKPAYYRPWTYYSAADVEITAYYVLCLFYNTDSPQLITLLPFIRWLTNNRNSLGGWYSTQDTVVALQALSVSARLINGRAGAGMNLDLTIQHGSNTFTSKIQADNKLVYNRKSVSPNDRIQISAAGSGCAVIQLSVLFNSKNFEKHAIVSPFIATGTVTPTSTCDQAKMRTCLQYRSSTTGGMTTMVIMNVKMASGWKVKNKTALDASIRSGGLRMVEETVDNSLVLYYDPVEASQMCADFDVERVVEVMDVDPMIVQVYDYYQSEQVVEANVPVYSGACKNTMTSKSRGLNTGNTGTCPKCATDETKVKNALTTHCSTNNYPVILAKKQATGSQWEFRQLSSNNMVLGWTSQLTLSSSCSCIPEIDLILISSNNRVIVSGEPIVVDNSWQVIDVHYVELAYPKLTAPCKNKLQLYPFTEYLAA